MIRPTPLLLATLALGSCRQPNPEWLGPDSTMVLASTSEGSTIDGGETEVGPDPTASESSAGSTTTAPPDPMTPVACAPAPILGDGPCPAACDSCRAGRCQIRCNGDACESQAIACPDGWPCDIACDGNDSCKDADLQCPPERDCTVDCRGPDSCKSAVIDCGSMPCAVHCGPQSDACEDLQVLCAQADTQVTCEGGRAPSLEPRGSSCACQAIDCG